jgi:hypothetical protein
MSVAKQGKIPTKRVHPPQRKVILNPSKGLNNLVSPTLIDDKEWSDIMNCELDEGGVLRKRSGYVPIGSGLTAARGLGVYRTEVVNQMVTIDNGVLKYFNGTAWNSAAGSTFTPGNDVAFTQARLKLFIWNGADGGSYFDGTTVTRPGTMPKASFSVYYQNKHIASGVPGQPSRLYISNITDASDFTVTTGGTQPQPDSTNDAENGNPNVPGATVFAGTPALTEANVIDVRKNDGDKITGLGLFQDLVVIFKERSVYQLAFDSNGNPTVTPITYATGTVSHKSIVAVENDIYFLSREGIRILGNQQGYISSSGSTIRTRVISIRIQPTMDTINTNYLTRCNGAYYNYKYILSAPMGSSNAITNQVVYDTRFDAFVLWKNFNAQAMVRYMDINNKQGLYFLDDGGTQVYLRSEGTYNDNGVAIEAWATAKAFAADEPDLTKFWVDLRIMFRRLNGQITFTVYQDGATTVGTAIIGSGSTRGIGLRQFGSNSRLGTDGKTAVTGQITSFVDDPESIGLNLDSRTIRYKVYNNRLNENFVILGTVYAYYPKSHFVFDSSKKIYI